MVMPRLKPLPIPGNLIDLQIDLLFDMMVVPAFERHGVLVGANIFNQ